jgi:hypothetical protein
MGHVGYSSFLYAVDFKDINMLSDKMHLKRYSRITGFLKSSFMKYLFIVHFATKACLKINTKMTDILIPDRTHFEEKFVGPLT